MLVNINLDRTLTAPGGADLNDCNFYLIFITFWNLFSTRFEATINSQNYTRGQLLLEDASGNPIVTNTAAANLVDDSGNVVAVQFSEDTRVEVKDIDMTAGSQNTIILQ